MLTLYHLEIVENCLHNGLRVNAKEASSETLKEYKKGQGYKNDA